MSTLIAIDPGESTGVALFIGPRLVSVETTSSPHDEIRALLRTYIGATVVRETAPTVHRHNAECIEEVEQVIDTHATGPVYPVNPSQWKGHPFATLRGTDDPVNAHERDVVRLGRWFLAMRRHNALSIEPVEATPTLSEAERGRLEAELNEEHFEQPA